MMDIDEYDEFGRTPLMNAAMEGDLEEVRRLLAHGADPNKTDEPWGMTTAANFAGRLARESHIHRQVYELLLSVTADVETEAGDSRNAARPAVEMRSLADTQPPVWYRGAAFAERFVIRVFRVIAGTAIVGIAIWLFIVGVDTLSKPFASLSPLGLIGGILAVIVALLLLAAALAVAFWPRGESRVYAAWYEKQRRTR